VRGVRPAFRYSCAMTADIKRLDLAGLAAAVTRLGAPPYRTAQIARWLYVRGAASFDEMTDLPAALRADLTERFSLSVPDVVERQISRRDGTRKYLLRLGDGATIETVGMPGGDRLTVCVSTQAGCAMGCVFCATGRAGFVRDLGCGEIVDQVTVVGADLGSRVSNVVLMGQGEPFANYDAVIGSMRILNSRDGPGIGARHLTVSTCGMTAMIRRFADEPEQFTLAVSLHSALQATRDRLMPAMKSEPLGALRSALLDYAGHGRRPTLEYALIGGVNDSDAELAALLAFCADLPCHVNLIPVNPVAGSRARLPDGDVARRFASALRAARVETSVRVERGADIDAACGQLRQRRESG
jgi:23S rRNA (adenine2503-C2)-methyltransferase